MSAATKTDPLALRDELLDQLQRIQERGDEHGAEQARVTAELHEAHAKLAELRIAEVTGEATPAEVEKAAAEVKSLEAQHDELTAAAEPIATALKRNDRAMLTLYKQHRDVFEAEAEEASAAAVEALNALREPLKAAGNAWFAAASAWAVVDRRLDFPGDLSPCPPFPFDVAIPDWQPRPHERRLDTGQPEELPAGTIAVFVDMLGEELGAEVGDDWYRELLASDRHRLVRHVPPKGN
jgi:hypothetical protein